MLRRRYIPSMWNEMERLQREMNRLFENVDQPGLRAAGYPALNVWMNEEAAVITAELPGVDVSDLEISVVGETVTLSGQRRADESLQSATYQRQERGVGKFTRTIDLPFSVDSDKVEATLEKGILRVNLPRSEKDKPRKVMVKSVN